jgi:signal transduction histidine kinase
LDDSEPLDRLIAAEQDERRRIALFLHDGPVQNLSGIALMLDAALHSVETGKLDDATKVLS